MSIVSTIEAEISAGGTIVIDGATGTEIERGGAEMHSGAWCAMATETHPDILRAVHERYVRAGARVLTANTFSSNRNMLEPAGLGDRFESLNRQAVALALEARANCAATDSVAVAGSLSHQIPVERGTDYRIVGRAVPGAAQASARFVEMAELLANSGAELLLVEMMSDPDLANLAIEAATGTGLPVWVGYSVRLDDAGELVSHSRPDMSAREMFAEIPLPGVSVAGVMHSNAQATGGALEMLREHWAGPLMAYPDSGTFRMPNWQFEEIMSTDEFVAFCREWLTDGVQIVGGCCGLGVEHIEALSAALARKAVPA